MLVTPDVRTSVKALLCEIYRPPLWGFSDTWQSNHFGSDLWLIDARQCTLLLLVFDQFVWTTCACDMLLHNLEQLTCNASLHSMRSVCYDYGI